MVTRYINGQLTVDGVSLETIAKAHSTPCYVYSEGEIQQRFKQYDEQLVGIEHLICYAVKANSNLSILSLLNQLNSGFDIVSGGELARCLAAGVAGNRIVFSGVGKQNAEIEQALKADIYCFNVESHDELNRIASIANTLGVVAPIALRINPDVDAKTHPYIATGMKNHKFGLALEQAEPLLVEIRTNTHLTLRGLACHIGSQLTELSPFKEACQFMLKLIDKLQPLHPTLEFLNLGGGLGICYQDEVPPAIGELCETLKREILPRQIKLILEPGRSIVGAAGVLLSQVIAVKQSHEKQFAVIDAAMNDYLRPALYNAKNKIIEVSQSGGESANCYDIVGPICESADVFAHDLPLTLQQGDYVAILDVGAYGFSMSSHYNARPRGAEILVSKNQAKLIRRPEQLEELWAHELIDN